ncbi:MAG: hypothetical protein RRB13_04135 [bacterium]|nr:hypothetical protein [bacterium]
MLRKLDRLWVWALLSLVGWWLSCFLQNYLDRYLPSAYQPSAIQGMTFYFPLHGNLENQLGGVVQLTSEFPAQWRDGGLWLNQRNSSTAQLQGLELEAFDRTYSLSFWVQLSKEHFLIDRRPWSGTGNFNLFFVGHQKQPEQAQLEIYFNNYSSEIEVASAALKEAEPMVLGYDFKASQYAVHFLLVRQSEEMQVYLNGQLTRSLPLELKTQARSAEVALIGAAGSHAGGRFTTAEWAFFDRPLGPEVAQQLFEQFKQQGQRQGNPLMDWLFSRQFSGPAGPWFKTPTWAWGLWLPLYLLTLAVTLVFWVRWIPWLLWLLSDERESQF